jgi:DNA polymerase V
MEETRSAWLFVTPVHAGFPSPADDYRENTLDLNELVIQHPEATFYVQVAGDSMCLAGIDTGDILVVDRARSATQNAIVVAMVDGEFTVKRFVQKGEEIYLVPENPRYRPLKIAGDMEFQIWGVVTYCIKHLG